MAGAPQLSQPPQRRRVVGGVLAAVALVLSVLGAVVPAPAELHTGTTWYVSRRGDGTVGTSWATAWRQPSAINWAEVNPGDRIVLDGGPTPCPSDYAFGAGVTVPPGRTCGMAYRAPFVVGASGAPGEPITIALATSRGRDGTAVLAGGRTSPLPYCDQRSYTPSGVARSTGILFPARSHIVVNGMHRSGIMISGARSGIDLHSDRTSYVVLRNLELFDNGTFGKWRHGYRTDGEGISLAGNHITVDRTLIHDNGQDAIQDTDTGVPGTGHAPLHDITVSNSWLYEHRPSPLWPGYGFNSGAQDVPRQDCTHVDGLQVWGGGLDQQRMTFSHDVFGPFLAQGVYPGDNNVASFDHVVVTDSLFLNTLDHAIIGARIAADPVTPADWRISRVTSYLTSRPNAGLHSHGKLDLAGSGHTVTKSLFYYGYSAARRTTGSGNIWWGGDPVPGGRRIRPAFSSRMPAGAAPSFRQLRTLHLAPQCRACAGVGSPLHDVADLLHRIDRLNRTG
ncbi:MAG TPA: hypothetical protein VIG48_03780 [Jatrophihabitans sp.]|jgi:hypothetical protein